MVPSIPRRQAVAALYSHARRLPLTPTAAGGKIVSVRVLRAVLLSVAHYLDATTWAGAFPSMATLAERAGVSVSTARRAVRALEAGGILAVEVGGGRRSNRYALRRPEPAAPVEDRAPRSAGPTIPRGSTPPLLRFAQKRRTPAAPSPKRTTTIPDDLRPLADALTSRGLRASFSLTPDQVAEVRGAVARHGVAPLVRAAYAAHRATNPARWWSAWLDLWSGLTTPTTAPTPATAPADAAPPRDPDRTARGASAARASLAAYGIHRKAVAA